MGSKQMLNGRYKFRDKQWAFPHRQGLAGSNKLAAVGSLEGQICKQNISIILVELKTKT